MFIEDGDNTAPGKFVPEGTKSHQYLPIGQVYVEDKPSDDSYILNYFHWMTILKTRLTPEQIDLLQSKITSGHTIYINYDTNKISVPIHQLPSHQEVVGGYIRDKFDGNNSNQMMLDEITGIYYDV